MSRINPLVFVTSLVCGLTAITPRLSAGDLPFPPSEGKVAVSVPTDTTGRHPFRGFEFVPVGTSIMALDGTRLSLITTDMVEDVDSSAIATVVEPLAFSPNGKRIAVKAWQHGYQIYVMNEDNLRPIWASRGLIEKTEGTATYPYNHMDVLWSPSSDRLAIFSTVDDENLISVFDGDSLRVVFTNDQGGEPATAWSQDGTALLAAVKMGPKHWQVLRIPLGNEKPTVVFDAEEDMEGMAWNPAHDTLAFNVGASLYLYDGHVCTKKFIAPWRITFITWSTDGARLAVSDRFSGEIVVVQTNGHGPWSVTDKIGGKWIIPNIVWLDARQFAFVLVTSEPRGTKLYLGDAVTQTLNDVVSEDLVCTTLQPITGGVLFFKVTSRGPWHDVPEGLDSSAHRDRTLKIDLFYLNAAESRSVRLTRDAFKTTESDDEYGPSYYPVYWVKRP